MLRDRRRQGAREGLVMDDLKGRPAVRVVLAGVGRLRLDAGGHAAGQLRAMRMGYCARATLPYWI